MSCIDAFPFLCFQMFHSRLQNNSTSQLTNKNTLWMIGKVSWMFFYSCRPRNGVQCYSGPEFGFSNVPQKCVKTMENLNVHYACVILRVLGMSVRKQNNLHILLAGYEKHFTRVRLRVCVRWPKPIKTLLGIGRHLQSCTDPTIYNYLIAYVSPLAVSFPLAMIYEKVLSYQSKHKEGPLQYNLPPHSNGETVESNDQESSSGLLVVLFVGGFEH